MAKIQPSAQRIHFPLSFLRILLPPSDRARKRDPRDVQRVAQCLLTYGYVSMARHEWQQQIQTFHETFGGNIDDASTTLYNLPRQEVAQSKNLGELPYYHQSIYDAGKAAFEAMGFQYTDADGNLTSEISEEKWGRDLRSALELERQADKGDAWVAIHREIVEELEVRENKWTWDLFVVYCAILSKMGSDRVKRITYAEIQVRADGYRSQKIIPTGHEYSLTIDQIRTRVDNLERRELIETHSKRHTRQRHYSIPHRIESVPAMMHVAKKAAKRSRSSDRSEKQTQLEEMEQLYREKDQRAAAHATRTIRTGKRPAPSRDRGAGDSGGNSTPPVSTPAAPADVTPPRIVEPGKLMLNGENWYSGAHLLSADLDGAFVANVLENFDRIEHEGETYYSTKRRLVSA